MKTEKNQTFQEVQEACNQARRETDNARNAYEKALRAYYEARISVVLAEVFLLQKQGLPREAVVEHGTNSLLPLLCDAAHEGVFRAVQL